MAIGEIIDALIKKRLINAAKDVMLTRGAASAAASIPVPNTDPQQYIMIGDMESIRRMMEGVA